MSDLWRRGGPDRTPVVVARSVTIHLVTTRCGIERACVEDVGYRVICAQLTPDHSTIAEFRRRQEHEIGASLSTSGETLAIEELLTLSTRTENA